MSNSAMGSDPTGMGQIESRLCMAIWGRRGLTPAPPIPDTYGRYGCNYAIALMARIHPRNYAGIVG